MNYTEINPIASFEGYMHPHNYQQMLWEPRDENSFIAFCAGQEIRIHKNIYKDTPTYELSYLFMTHPAEFTILDDAKNSAEDFAKSVLHSKLEILDVKIDFFKPYNRVVPIDIYNTSSKKSDWEDDEYSSVTMLAGLEVTVSEGESDFVQIYFLHMTQSEKFSKLEDAKKATKEFVKAVLVKKVRIIEAFNEKINIKGLNKDNLLTKIAKLQNFRVENLLNLSHEGLKTFCYEQMIANKITREHESHDDLGWFYRPLYDNCNAIYLVNEHGNENAILMAAVDHLLYEKHIETF